MNLLLCGLAALTIVFPTAAFSAPSDDLLCYATSLDMAKYITEPEAKAANDSFGSFFLGRLSIVEPNTAWFWVAAAEKHMTPEEALPIIKKCTDRANVLQHISPANPIPQVDKSK
jgi:hypothetical protein